MLCCALLSTTQPEGETLCKGERERYTYTLLAYISCVSPSPLYPKITTVKRASSLPIEEEDTTTRDATMKKFAN
jgi:hypothetical protein